MPDPHPWMVDRRKLEDSERHPLAHDLGLDEGARARRGWRIGFDVRRHARTPVRP